MFLILPIYEPHLTKIVTSRKHDTDDDDDDDDVTNNVPRHG